MIRRIALTVAAVATLVLAGVGVAAAQDASAAPASDGCVGTWMLHVTALGQPASTAFPVNATFHSDGTFITQGPPVSPGPADAPDRVSFMSTGQGVWSPPMMAARSPTSSTTRTRRVTS